MSVSNLLNPETKNQDWSDLYCNSITANNIFGPISPNPIGFVESKTAGASYPMGNADEYKVPNTDNTDANNGNGYYQILPDGIRILNAGWYIVQINCTNQTTLQNSIINHALAINGVRDAGVCNQDSSTLVNFEENNVSASDLLELSVNDELQIAVASSISLNSIIWRAWKISVIPV
jgi:hypothetical protein